jgi:hypothetical protein
VASPLQLPVSRTAAPARGGVPQEMPVTRLGTATVLYALCLATSCALRPPTLTARTSLPIGVGGGGDAPVSAPAPADAPPDDGQLIEAGCSFNGSQIKGDPGTVRHIACPAGCDKDVNVFGTDVYTSDTPVCVAAIHAGAISDRGGQATVVIEGGRPAYRGSKRNGVSSRDWGSYRASFRFTGVVAAAPPPAVAAPVVIEAGCSFNGREIHADPGTVHRVSCPAGCKTDAPIWGSDPYTSDSPICVAAIHAGLVTERGGEITVVVEDGRPAYRGSKRNGVESRDHGAYQGSYRLRR